MDSKAQRGVWKVAIEGEHVPALPPCPADICPIRYSQLLFGHTCFACGRSNSRKVSYKLGLRLCKPCWEENIVHEKDASDYIGAAIAAYPELQADSRFRLPDVLENLRRDMVSSGSNKRVEVYSKAELRHFAADYLPMLAVLLRCNCETRRSALELAIGCRKEFVDLWNEFGGALAHVPVQAALERVKLSDIRERDIIGRLQNTGYATQSFPSATEPEADEWKRLLRKPETLTDQKWTNLLPTLQQMMAKVHRRRWVEAEEARVTARISFLLDEYDKLMTSARVSEADRRCMPNHAHAKQLRTMAMLAHSTDFPHPADLQRAFRGRATEVIAEAMQFRQDTEFKLFALLVEHYQEFSPDMLNFAAQLGSYATSLFKCMLCSDREDIFTVTELTLEGVLAHWRQRHPDVLLNLDASSPNTVPPPTKARDGGSVTMVKPSRDSWCFIRTSQLSTDIALETMDDLVARGLVYCPCKISLLHRYTWADLLAHCVKEVKWTYSMFPDYKDLWNEDRRKMADNHLPGCLTVVQTQADVAQYQRPDDATAVAIAHRLQSRASDRTVHCTRCRKVITDGRVFLHKGTLRGRRRSLSQIAVSADEPWMEVAHHLRNKHNITEFKDSDVTFLLN
ncbi:hypothetical protein C8T65DRAFT_831151 [Cerioporus squamosus]|nr:hypothetical protein C8T65DRAFT_831151 [Cerioporus squamosus]